MPYGYYGFYWMDYTYIFVIIGAVICLIASAGMNSTFSRYQRVRSMSGMTGAMAAERILRDAGIHDVQVQHIQGNLTDHYNPMNKTLSLSDSVYNSTSVAAVGVAAHECGHAIQHAKGYVPLRVRGAFVPIANIGSNLAWPLIIIGDLPGVDEQCADPGGNYHVFPGGTVSADHAAGGIQRFPPGNAGTGAYRDPGKCRTERYEKSSDSGCHDLCGKCRIHDPAASAVDYFIRRKKQG